MARNIRNAKMDTRSARARLLQRHEPYWVSITPGHALGYRKGKTGGAWVARRYDPSSKPKLRHEALGAADDILDPDGSTVFSFAQAQERAREWFIAIADEKRGGKNWRTYTVKKAVDEYLEYYRDNSDSIAGIEAAAPEWGDRAQSPDHVADPRWRSQPAIMTKPENSTLRRSKDGSRTTRVGPIWTAEHRPI